MEQTSTVCQISVISLSSLARSQFSGIIVAARRLLLALEHRLCVRLMRVAGALRIVDPVGLRGNCPRYQSSEAGGLGVHSFSLSEDAVPSSSSYFR